MIWVFVVFSLLFVFLSCLSFYLRKRELRTMTVEKLVSRCVDFQKKNDVEGLSRFLSRHLGFCVIHRSAIESRLAELRDSENSKKEG